MLFSQNPNGQVQAYTDQGIFIGIIESSQPLKSEKSDREKTAKQLVADAMACYARKVEKTK